VCCEHTVVSVMIQMCIFLRMGYRLWLPRLSACISMTKRLFFLILTCSCR
jgi:hypothetical protein